MSMAVEPFEASASLSNAAISAVLVNSDCVASTMSKVTGKVTDSPPASGPAIVNVPLLSNVVPSGRFSAVTAPFSAKPATGYSTTSIEYASRAPWLVTVTSNVTVFAAGS